RRRRGRARLRRLRLLVLSAAGARHLVAAADPARRGGGHAGRRRLRLPRRGRDHGRLPGRRPAARPARLARALVGAPRLPHHGAGVPGHREPGTGGHGGDPGPLPPAGGTAGGGQGM
ncbi:LOW QUALITY PROTEIN: transmembrane transporter, partial [Streptomyces sviceus ATCC 29083]